MNNKYKVLVEFELEDVKQEVNSVVELEEELASPLVEAGNLEVVAESQERTNTDIDAVNPIAVNVLNEKGEVVKTFTRDSDGDEFIELAKTYAVDNGLTVEIK